VQIRCNFAELAQREAEMADARAADARHRTEAQLAVLADVLLAADPTASRAAKEHAHAAFKAAISTAQDRFGVEGAALGWLTDINRINGRIRLAQTRLLRERETADSLLAERDKLMEAAVAARATAEAAREACLAAQRGVSGEPEAESPSVDEPTLPAGASMAATEATAGVIPLPEAVPQLIPAEMAAVGSTPDVAVGSAPVGDSVSPIEPAPDDLRLDLRANPPQVIVRLLNRDLWTLNWLVVQLAGGNPTLRSAWKLRLSNFVDAAIAAAIEDACFEFSPGHPFWGMFTREQAQEIARGLTALGYRYDGFGDFVDGRVPDQRDLALAISSAGLYPVRIRYWPKPAEAAQLFRSVRVATEILLAGRAPSLALGELVVVLGRRAEQLADMWNEWQRLRPLLLSQSVS
jgi:hypothetical protein